MEGMWNFRIDASESRFQGFADKWYSRPLKQVSPSSTISLAISLSSYIDG
jgi:hypothetical protein